MIMAAVPIGTPPVPQASPGGDLEVDSLQIHSIYTMAKVNDNGAADLSPLEYSGVNTGYTGYVLAHEQELFVVDICIMLLSLVGNFCAVYFICGSKKSRTTHNITIVSMAVSNLIIATFVIPTYMAITKYDAMSNSVTPFLCKLNKYIWYWCKTVNIYSILAMVVDRYFKVMKPYKSNYLSGRCMFFLNFVWFFGAAYNIWEIVLNTSFHILVDVGDNQNVTVRKCIANDYFTSLQDGFLVSDFLVIYFLPFITIMCLSVRIVMKLCLQVTEPEQRRKGRRKFLMGLLLAVMFYLCQLPLEIMQPMIYFKPDLSRQSLSTIKLLETISFLNGLLNVAAYVLCSNDLHTAMRSMYLRQRLQPVNGSPGTPGPHILLRACSNENMIDGISESRDAVYVTVT